MYIPEGKKIGRSSNHKCAFVILSLYILYLDTLPKDPQANNPSFTESTKLNSLAISKPATFDSEEATIEKKKNPNYIKNIITIREDRIRQPFYLSCHLRMKRNSGETPSKPIYDVPVETSHIRESTNITENKSYIYHDRILDAPEQRSISFSAT